MGVEKRDSARRPGGVAVLAAVSLFYGLQSLWGALQGLPAWLAAARRHQYATGSVAWVELLIAISALATAYGLWRQRRWSRIPFGICLFASVAIACLIAAIGLGEHGGARAWIGTGVVALAMLALAAWVGRYVWRHT